MIALGSDHGGYELKQEVIHYLEEKGIEYRDFGCSSTESCDYPEYGAAAARAVASGECEKGIVICTTGIGISIAANKIKGIRCGLCEYAGHGRRPDRTQRRAGYCGDFPDDGIFRRGEACQKNCRHRGY